MSLPPSFPPIHPGINCYGVDPHEGIAVRGTSCRMQKHRLQCRRTQHGALAAQLPRPRDAWATPEAPLLCTQHADRDARPPVQPTKTRPQRSLHPRLSITPALGARPGTRGQLRGGLPLDYDAGHLWHHRNACRRRTAQAVQHLPHPGSGHWAG